MLTEITEPFGVSKGMATALLTPAVLLLAWMVIRRIRKALH